MRTNLPIGRWLALCCTSAAGCRRAPTIEIVGSFFPAWLVSLVIALFLTALCRVLLVRARQEGEVGPLVVFYPCLILLFTCVTWLILF